MKEKADQLIDNIQSVLYIDRIKLEHLIASLTAGGHVMLADTHGVGKTSLARALAGSILWPEEEGEYSYFNRIQCTVDLLPQDILGYSRIVGNAYKMLFIRGPIFSHFLLCDEINLLTPKTQGSFFQAMEEKIITIEGETHTLPPLFFIIATMNLKGSHLFPLPAPQLDRFMIRLSLGYPDFEDECSMVRQHGNMDGWSRFGPVIRQEELLDWMARVDGITLHPDVLSYIVRVIQATRSHPQIEQGASPRTGVKVSRLVRALALIRGMDYVSIDLVKEILQPAVAHRISCFDPDVDAAGVLEEIIRQTPVDSTYKEIVTER